MNIAIVHFSARNNGNCAAIAQELTELHAGASISLWAMGQASITPCRGCGYECFARADACPYAADDVRAVYDTILHADLAYYILPNYADCPPALYFAFNERSQCIFQGNEALLNAYLAVPKRFIIVSNQTSMQFSGLPDYHMAEGATPALLYLPPRRFSPSSISGTMMEAPQARDMLRQFVQEHEKSAVPQDTAP